MQYSRPPAVLGLDLGTSQVKALLCTPDGTALGQGTAAYQVSTPRPGWAEINPEHWWQATCIAVRAAVGPASAEVAGLAVAGQMHGLILCTERAVAYGSGRLRTAGWCLACSFLRWRPGGPSGGHMPYDQQDDGHSAY